jgi:hypothetical protein
MADADKYVNKTWTVKLKRDIHGWNCNSCNAHKIPAGTVVIIHADMVRKNYAGRHNELGFSCTREDFDLIKEDKPNG